MTVRSIGLGLLVSVCAIPGAPCHAASELRPLWRRAALQPTIAVNRQGTAAIFGNHIVDLRDGRVTRRHSSLPHSAAAFSPSGTSMFLVSSIRTYDQGIKEVNATTGAWQRNHGAASSGTTLDLSPDGRYLAVDRFLYGQRDLVLRDLSANRNLRVRRIVGTSGMDVSSSGRIAYIEGGIARVWNPISDTVEQSFQNEGPGSIHFCRNDYIVLTSQWSAGVVRFWRRTNGELLRSYPGEPIVSTAVSPSSLYVAACSQYSARVFSAATNAPVATIQFLSPADDRSISFVDDDRVLVTGGDQAQLFEWRSGVLLQTIGKPAESLSLPRWEPTGSAVSFWHDGSIIVANASTGAEQGRVSPRHSGETLGPLYTVGPFGKQLVVTTSRTAGSPRRSLLHIRLPGPALEREVPLAEDTVVRALAISPTGKTLVLHTQVDNAVYPDEYRLETIDVSTWQVTASLRSSNAFSYSSKIYFSRSGDRFAFSDGKYYECEPLSLARDLPYTLIGISQDGRLVASRDWIIEATTGIRLAELPAGSAVRSISGDLSVMTQAGTDGQSLTMTDIRTGVPIGSRPVDFPPSELAVSPTDGRVAFRYQAGSRDAGHGLTPAPFVLQPALEPFQFVLRRGRLLSGSLADLLWRDEKRLTFQNATSADPDGRTIDVELHGTSPMRDPGQFVFSLTYRADLSGGLLHDVLMWNWGTASWDLVNVRSETPNLHDRTVEVAATGFARRFVRSTDGRVRVRLAIRKVGNPAGATWRVQYNQAGWVLAK